MSDLQTALECVEAVMQLPAELRKLVVAEITQPGQRKRGVVRRCSKVAEPRASTTSRKLTYIPERGLQGRVMRHMLSLWPNVWVTSPSMTTLFSENLPRMVGTLSSLQTGGLLRSTYVGGDNKRKQYALTEYAIKLAGVEYAESA